MCWEERGKKAEEGDDGRAGRSSQFRDSWPRRGEEGARITICGCSFV